MAAPPNSNVDKADFELSAADLPLKKKDKLQLKHEALLQRLGVTGMAYSKSHMKRAKRKEKEQLSTDLTAVNEAITAIEEHRNSEGTTHKDGHPTIPAPRQGQIGEGQGRSLTSNQRKRTFAAEQLRHKLIMQDSNFVVNPFQTIRTHAQNTLIKHQ
ncbi:hypothetical protein M422DRAFT_251469 [Sphaerobolus stellatus SS14]|uniref:Ribosome biogenesis protein SLX9 n=1 Tax=Sphaerobolus stellatus (strain SS14) TaxID=990650 RepID=A0A0C9W1A8_SPHS4|nr:hypothetical protein M422DRAFT_251469 [Sphaerobolus stellatus SS14]